MPDDDYRESITASIRASLVSVYSQLIEAKTTHPKRMEKDRDWIREGPKKAGAPKRPRFDTIDAPLRDAMEREAAETEDIKPYRFARIAVKNAEMPEHLHDAAIRRLARWWRRKRGQN